MDRVIPLASRDVLGMGNTPCKSVLIQLKRLFKEQRTAVKTKTLEDFLKAIEIWSPWFITSGALNISER